MSIPEGWAIVPIKPLPSMIPRRVDLCTSTCTGLPFEEQVWDWMVRHSPKPDADGNPIYEEWRP